MLFGRRADARRSVRSSGGTVANKVARRRDIAAWAWNAWRFALEFKNFASIQKRSVKFLTRSLHCSSLNHSWKVCSPDCRDSRCLFFRCKDSRYLGCCSCCEGSHRFLSGSEVVRMFHRF